MARQDRFRSLGKVFVALALLSLGWPASVVSAASVPAGPPCAVSWKNAAGGDWSNGRNWSTGAPPTRQQKVCITIGLGAPVVLSSAGTARSLTVGGQTGTTELELSGATLVLGSNSTVGPTGAVVITCRISTVQVQHRAVLTNDGVITILGAGLQLELRCLGRAAHRESPRRSDTAKYHWRPQSNCYASRLLARGRCAGGPVPAVRPVPTGSVFPRHSAGWSGRDACRADNRCWPPK